MIKPETLAVYGECSMQDRLYFLDKSPSLLIFLKERPPKGRTRLSKEMRTGQSRASASLLYPRHCSTSQFIASLHYMANGSKLPGTRVLQSAVTRSTASSLCESSHHRFRPDHILATPQAVIRLGGPMLKYIYSY